MGSTSSNGSIIAIDSGCNDGSVGDAAIDDKPLQNGSATQSSILNYYDKLYNNSDAVLLNPAKYVDWDNLGRFQSSSLLKEEDKNNNSDNNEYDEKREKSSFNNEAAIERNAMMLIDLLNTALEYDDNRVNINRKHIQPLPPQDKKSLTNKNFKHITPNLSKQIYNYVKSISNKYHNVGFHTFEHASHVMLSACNICYMLQLCNPLLSNNNNNNEFKEVVQDVSSTIYDPWLHFTIVFAALLHDIDHKGIPNSTLLKKCDEIAIRYHGQYGECLGSYAELNSITIGLSLLLGESSDNGEKKDGDEAESGEGGEYDEFARILQNGLGHDGQTSFYKTVTDLVLCTDIASKERRELGMKKWKRACYRLSKEVEEVLPPRRHSDAPNHEGERRRKKKLGRPERRSSMSTVVTDNTTMSRESSRSSSRNHQSNNNDDVKKGEEQHDYDDSTALPSIPILYTSSSAAARAICEQIIQVADVSHTMQHFTTFTKWNKHLYHEVLAAYQYGQQTTDNGVIENQSQPPPPPPHENWYESQIGFFDHYIIPLAQRLDSCNLFKLLEEDDSKHVKFAELAMRNKEEWIKCGKECTRLMVEEAEMIELPPPMPIVPLSSSSVATSDAYSATTPMRKSSNSEEQVVMRRSFMTSNDRSDTMKVGNTSETGGKVEEARDRLADITLVQEGGDTMGDSLLDESNVESTTSPRMLHHDDLQSSFRSQSSFRLNDNDDNSIVSIPGTVETATSRVSFAGSRSSRQGSESLAKWGKSASSGLSYENDVDSSVNAIVPQLLVQQLIDSLRNEVQNRDEISRLRSSVTSIDVSTSDRSGTSFGEIHTLRDAVAKYQSAGSVQRHRGALLFVDISGFTKLSQNYPVEDFKTFINTYFTKIINLVTSFGGEVVKFAGDALYAIWTTSGGSSDTASDSNTDDDTSHAMNIEKCTTCAIAINAECNNYKVSKSYNKRRSSAVSSGSTGSSTQNSRGQGEVLYRIQDKNTEYEERGSTLTVYCGVSEGIMVGIDVFANNRAEFFLVGRPLKDVAKAESLAGPGELVVSPSVYSSLKTNKTKLASKLVFTSIESNFQRVDCPTSQSTINDMLIYFKEKGGASFVKSDAQSMIGDLLSTCSTLEETEISSLQLDIMRLLESHRHEATRDVVGKFTAELRRVVILFISIEYEPVLPEDTRGDNLLLENFQNIYSIISESVTSRSGQVRQFINDDKGTVFIASFGLRGSVILHPSDIAIDAAKEAQKKLEDIMDIQCCVGITLGKIFCGETGSFQRYEYSLLGPSVNLSARLMAKGAWGQINCDEELKLQTGRRHSFIISGTHKLKGYDEPVPFFMPIQDKEKKNNEQDDVVSFFSQRDEVLDIVDLILQSRKSNHIESTTQIKPSILLVKGDEGKGKDAFITALMKHPDLQSTSVILEANRCFHDDPFYCFIPIITRAILYHKESRERLISLKKRHKRSSVLSSFLANKSFQTQAYPNRTNIVPVELTPYLSLINDFVYKGFPLMKSSIEAKRLKEGAKGEKCIQVLSALIVRYLELRGKPCILAMVDMDKIDSYSKKVLNRILSTNANLLIIGGADDSTPHHDDDLLLGDTSTESGTFLTSILGEQNIHVETKNLQLLDKQTVFDLFKWSLRRDFSSEECDIIDQPEVHDKIFKLCGGMCHATSRLAHTFCTQYERDQNDDTSIDLLDYSHTFLNDTPSDFEEITWFRTDRMKPEEQMLLKIASVAGFDQYSFSQNLLEAVFLAVSQNEDATLVNEDSDNDYDSDGDFQVPSSIGCDVPTTVGIGEENGVNNMFQEDNFEQMLESLVAHNFLDEINVEMSDLSSMDSIAYRFRSDHERSVINGLMLQDQKKRTHFEVAAYYSSSFRRGGGDTSLGDNESSSLSTDITSVSATNWELFHVIALHYDLADVPIPAMLHYFDSSDALASLGVRDKAHGRLLSAYLMLEKVLHKASTIEVKIDESSEQRRHIAGEMIRTIGGDQLNDNVKTLIKLTKDRIRIAFDSDLFAFKKSLVVLQKFGQSVGTIEQNGYLFGSELYIQAILLLLLVLADDAFINLTSRLGSFLGQVDLQSMKGLSKREEISNDDDDGSSFSSDASCLHDTFDIDDLAISFPAFSGLLTFYRDSPIGANQVQETFLANLFVAVTQEANQMIHVLRTRCILSHLYLKHGNITQALQECEGIKDIYDHDRYSLDLVNTYGMDWCLICIATMASTYLFKGQIAAARNNIEFLKAQILKLDEFASSTKAMSKGTISSFHLLLDEFGSSVEIANGINATQYGYFFKPIGTLQEELANRELALSKNKTFDSSACDLNLLSVLSSDTSHEINQKRPMLEQSAETLSDRGIEAVKAALCETEIRNIALQGSSTADTIKQQIQYCEAGLLYLRQSLGQNDAGNHERRKNYLLCLYQKTGLLYWHHKLLQQLKSSFEIQVEDTLGINGTEIEDAKSSLDECRDLSEQYEYPFMTLVAGKRYINLGLDIHGGEELIRQALGRIDEMDCISVKCAP